MTYKAPVAEQAFVLDTVVELPNLSRYPQFSSLNDGILVGRA